MYFLFVVIRIYDVPYLCLVAIIFVHLLRIGDRRAYALLLVSFKKILLFLDRDVSMKRNFCFRIQQRRLRVGNTVEAVVLDVNPLSSVIDLSCRLVSLIESKAPPLLPDAPVVGNVVLVKSSHIVLAVQMPNSVSSSPFPASKSRSSVEKSSVFLAYASPRSFNDGIDMDFSSQFSVGQEIHGWVKDPSISFGSYPISSNTPLFQIPFLRVVCFIDLFVFTFNSLL